MDGLVEKKGKFIVIEGLDGVGKMVQSRLLADFLRKNDIPVVETEEPRYGTETGEFINRWLKNEFEFKSRHAIVLAFAMDRYEHDNEIREWLRSSWVVSSRYLYSTMAYQGGIFGVDLDWIERVHEFILKPDLVIYIDIDPFESVARRGEVDRLEKIEFQKKAREMYLKIAERFGFVVIDGMRPAINVAEDIAKAVEERFPEWFGRKS